MWGRKFALVLLIPWVILIYSWGQELPPLPVGDRAWVCLRSSYLGSSNALHQILVTLAPNSLLLKSYWSFSSYSQDVFLTLIEPTTGKRFSNPPWLMIFTVRASLSSQTFWRKVSYFSMWHMLNEDCEFQNLLWCCHMGLEFYGNHI